MKSEKQKKEALKIDKSEKQFGRKNNRIELKLTNSFEIWDL